MLNTLKKIGDKLLEGQGIWARLVTEPKHNPKKNNWICPILFDCIGQEIRFLKDDMVRFKKGESSVDYRYISSEQWGRNGKKCAITIETGKFKMLKESLFGKNKGDNGTMMESIAEFDQSLVGTSLYSALKEINESLSDQQSVLDIKKIKDELNLGKDDKEVLFYSLIRSNQINNGDPKKLFTLDGYEDFILGKFAADDKEKKGLDYITGEFSEKTIEANFSDRYSMHKVFQTTVFNYASNFSDFRKNFQSNPATLASLDKASDYVLNNFNTTIAGLNHIVVPNFLHKDLESFDLNQIKLFLDKTGELLFHYQKLDTDLDKSLPDVDLIWVNYIAFESDGNFFKVINHIKDINSAYLKKLIEVFGRTEFEFRSYIGGKSLFNLRSIYRMIPVRDRQKSKVNPVLNLFNDILEQKPIRQDLIFDHFITLVLCHWYGRSRAYTNIGESTSFDFSIKDAVYKYSALIYALKQLNLTDMEKETAQQEDTESPKTDFQKRVDHFFEKMDYSEQEKAMFYLGRVLSSVAYAQYKKGHESKPVLKKINFNGMDSQAVVRLSLDLSEKARQYTIHRETEWNFAHFRENFNEKDWPLTKEQNVFYLMAGYSFGLTKFDNQ